MGESGKPSPRATVLIIEDDDLTASNVQAGLTGAGYFVQRAANADQALVALESTPADLIILSLMLPDTDGLILCSRLKANFSTPIIVLTPRPGEVDRALALASGAADCVARPVNQAELLAQVNALVPRPESAQARPR
jgi:two-component system OmpR family response regulator